jgi:hypothetical protein
MDFCGLVSGFDHYALLLTIMRDNGGPDFRKICAAELLLAAK